MKIKIEISDTQDLFELIEIIGSHGHKVWREEGPDLAGYKTHFLIIEIDKNCITE